MEQDRVFSREDSRVALEFAQELSYLRNANQADDEGRVRLTGDFSRDKDTVASRLGYENYKALPSGTKTLISFCASVIRVQRQEKKKGQRRHIQGFEFVLRDYILELEKANKITSSRKE